MESIMPDSEFIAELKRMTAANDHGGVYRKTARWCADNCGVAANAPDKWLVRDNPAEYYRNVFVMFEGIFKSMEKCHRTNGEFSFGDIRYEVGKAMEREIAECFGKKTLDALNEGGR